MYITLTNIEVALIDNILQDYDLTFALHLSEKVRDIDENVGLYVTSQMNLAFLKTVLILRAMNPTYCNIYKLVDGVLHPQDILLQKTLDYYAKCFANRSQ